MIELRDYKDLDFYFTSPQQTQSYTVKDSVHTGKGLDDLVLVVKSGM